MRQKRRAAQDPIEAAIEAALCPGEFIDDSASWSFVDALHAPGSAIEDLVNTDPQRAVRLYETFLAGCYEKANELDDSSGSFGMFVDDLFSGWIKARQAGDADPNQTAAWLLARMDDDPWGFAYHLERDAAKVMNKANLAAFARRVRQRFEGEPGTGKEEPRDPQYARNRWGEVLRAIHVAQNDVSAYVALCEETETTAQDCLAVATLLRAKKPDEALAWIDRGLELDKKHPHGSMAGHDLAKLKREILLKVGRAGDAREEAWAEFRAHPSTYTYEELMRFVPKGERSAWHAKAMDAAAGADLGSLIGLWLETKEIDRLVDRLRRVKDSDLEALSHYTTEPAAKRLAKSHPAVAAKVFRALGMRILNAKKSKYYDAALSNLEDAKECYARAGLEARWNVVVAEVRQAHHRKVGFMGSFERLVAGQGPSEAPSFLERAKSRWTSRETS
jgi:hypothetical protein